ncbi:MAG TPA: hypothetical protein VGO71_20575 [Baekduia sp.]|nr:hypothetical protein [Baekduia sp.]
MKHPSARRAVRLRRAVELVISHRDADHARGVVALLGRRELDIGTIFIAADAAKDPTAPDTALVLAALDDAKHGGRCRVSRDLDAPEPSPPKRPRSPTCCSPSRASTGATLARQRQPLLAGKPSRRSSSTPSAGAPTTTAAPDPAPRSPDRMYDAAGL